MKDAEIIINDVVKGEYDLPKKFAPVVHEIPDAASKDAGKVLTMSKNGGPTWGEGGGSIQHDWYQNDSTAADYIKNRPGGYTQTTPGYEITWDGVVGDKVAVDAGEMQLVKVSDRVFTVEELIGATMVFGDTSLIVNNDTINSQNGTIACEAFLVFSAPTTIEGITIPESGTYFAKMGEEFVSSLSKPDSTTTIKIPAELTTVVGGYDREARTDVLFDGVVKPSDFVDAKTLQTGGGGPPKAPKRASSSQPTTQYCALITLATSLIDGCTVTGTVNGVGVHGEISGNLILYDVDDNKVLIIGAIGNMTACSLPDCSIPSSDLVISLTRSVQASPVVIPKEYLDLGIVNEHISYAQMTAETAYQKAETAQSTANTAQSTANTAKSTANTAKSTANTAKTTADTAQSTANNAKTTADTLTKNLTFILNPTTSNSGKFLTVDTKGKPTWTSISNAEGGSY